MNKSKKTREDLIADTRESAIAILEDYDHLKEVVDASETKAVDVRHASAILRRWLVEGALERVAGPRVGRLQILAIDNSPVYRASRSGKISSFVSGGASVHGIYLVAGMVNEGNRPIPLEGFAPVASLPLNLESFLRQRVIYTDGTWITRRKVIKFVANIDSGVHDGQVRDREDGLLAGFRQQVTTELLDVASLNDLPTDYPDDVTHIPSQSWNFGEPAAGISLKNYNPQQIVSRQRLLDHLG